MHKCLQQLNSKLAQSENPKYPSAGDHIADNSRRSHTWGMAVRGGAWALSETACTSKTHAKDLAILMDSDCNGVCGGELDNTGECNNHNVAHVKPL